MQIRKANMDDIDTLVALRMDFIREMHPALSRKQIASHAEVLRDYFRRHINLDFHGYFAVADGDVAAVIHLLVFERPANPRIPTGKAGMILNVYTKPPFRNRGYASTLLKEAIHDAGKLSASVIELQESDIGRHVYERLGFRVAQSDDTPMVYYLHTEGDGSGSFP